ncbi:MAG: TonB-dependent receptor, partial [Aquabacterium sp.]|nr:TonB-dependent receptor [Aquabacterium sp.]
RRVAGIAPGHPRHGHPRAGHPTRTRPAQAAPAAPAAAPASAPGAVPAAGGASTARADLGRVTITGRLPSAGVTGFGDQPLALTPVAASVLGADDLREMGIERLAGITATRAAIGDAYNTTGYWDYLSVRGFVLDNRYNYRRDGLPINAETRLPLANKAALEVLQGASGMQAGTSAPGGLVDLVVKRPDRDLSRLRLDARQGEAYGAGLDLSRRLGEAREFGLRLNLAAERLNTRTDATRGRAHLVALAADWRLGGGALLEAELEHGVQSQPSVPGFSMLGDRVPAPADPRINLNHQPWSQPVRLEGDTASLRWTQPLGAGWKAVAHGMTQRLRSDDRIAFPYGCYDAGADLYYADRYCPDGSFDLYDYRSENERRRSDALDLGLQGRLELAGMTHQLAAGLLATRYRQRLQMQAYNYVGSGRIDGSVMLPASPELTDQNTNRDERSTELYLRDAVRLAPDWQAWLGLRHSRLQRDSVRTDGSRPTGYDAHVTSPWLALSWEWAPQHIAYASWGRGMETDVVPNRARYTNRGEALLSRSRQAELGLKGSASGRSWSLAAFEIRRAQTAPVGSNCASDTPGGTCTVVPDGLQRHRGLEGQVEQTLGAWKLGGSAMLLQARRIDSRNPALDGQRPANVPARSLRARAAYDFTAAALPGLSAAASLVHEGERRVSPYAGAASIPAWTRLDLAAQWRQTSGAQRLTWTAGLDNATNRRAWREAPYQFEHIYLFPMAERSWRLGLEVDL